MLLWHAHLGPVTTSLIVLAGAAWLRILHRRMLLKMPPRRAALLLAPKAAIAILLLAALFEPSWSVETLAPLRRLAVLVDTSASMAIRDGEGTRLERARRAVDGLGAALRTRYELDEYEFDTHLRRIEADARSSTPTGGTDLAACLARMTEGLDPASCAGVIVVTDGGDEAAARARRPPVPLHVISIGPEGAWSDAGIASLTAPALAESETEFEAVADLESSPGPDPAFAKALGDYPVRLERDDDGRWTLLEERRASLSHGRARVSFRVRAGAPGAARYRILAGPAPGEVSALNNAREFSVDVQRKSIHVLYFTRELGMDFKMLRNEVARDPGVAFTALIRTMGEQFLVQGERFPGDEEIEAGFPSEAGTLALYDVVILGSFPASDWTPARMRALTEFVENGGGVIFLGGESSFGLGGYAATPLAPLFPWELRADEPEVMRGAFPVAVTPLAAAHPVTAGIGEALAAERDATLESLNQPGAPKPGATVLMNASAGAVLVPFAAIQPYGKGRVLGLGSNTLWIWARRSQGLSAAYGRLIRQAVRHLAGQAEGGRFLAVRWDRDRYSPGDEARVSVTAAGREAASALRLSATLTTPSEDMRPPVEPEPGLEGAFSMRLAFPFRGDYTLRLAAARADAVVETYERTLRVAPLLPEGARLAPDLDDLGRLAASGGGLCVPDGRAEDLAGRLLAADAASGARTERPIAQAGPWFLLALLLLFLIEWALRRRFYLA